jgi:hypothetical protein
VEPAQRRTDIDGNKYYDHPFRTEDDPNRPGHQRPAQYVSVTQALSAANKPALVYWASNLAAKRAMDNLPKLIGSLLVPDCGRSAARTEPYGCKECEACIRRWVALFHQGEKERRAREGTAAHDIWERWTKTGEWSYTPLLSGDPDVDQYVPTHETMAPYMQSLRTFVAEYGLRPEDVIVCECTVWNHSLRYAGTLDCIIDLWPRTKKSADTWARIARYGGVQAGQPVRVIVDLKSREGEDAAIYAEYTLQLAPYRSAESMLPKHAGPELETPMISTDGAVILQVRPDGYTFRPVLADGAAFRAFRGLLDTYRWQISQGDKSTQVGTFPLPDAWPKASALTWERATLANGKLCPCIGCDDPTDGRCKAQHDAVRPMGLHTREVDKDGNALTESEARWVPLKRTPAKKVTRPSPDRATAGEQDAEGVEAPKVTRKRPPAKKAVGPSPLSDLRHSFTGARASINPDDIPF